jgi:very-short-patch-repair endonuclease
MLDEHGVRYLRQKEIGHYHVDFYLPQTNSVVEVQGCYWHGCLQCGHDDAFHRTRRRQDASRHTYLRRKGYQVELLWEHDFRQEATAISTMILAKWKKDSSPV